MNATRTLPRNGRPPAVREEGDTFFVKVRTFNLAFKRGVKDLVRVDRTKGVPSEDVAYGKQIVKRASSVRVTA